MGKGQSAGIDAGQYTQCDKGHLVGWNHPQERRRPVRFWPTAPVRRWTVRSWSKWLCAARGCAVCRFEFAYMAARRQEWAGARPVRRLSCSHNGGSPCAGATAGHRTAGHRRQVHGRENGGLLADELEAETLVCLGYPFHPAEAGQASSGPSARAEDADVDRAGRARCTPVIASGWRTPAVACDRPALARVADHDLKPLKRRG